MLSVLVLAVKQTPVVQNLQQMSVVSALGHLPVAVLPAGLVGSTLDAERPASVEWPALVEAYVAQVAVAQRSVHRAVLESAED